MKAQVSVKEAVSGFKLSLANAEALLEDAKVLRSAGRPHRAIALAVLSMEELGKLPRYCSVDRYRNRMPVWWKYFKSHETKIKMHATFALGRRTAKQRKQEFAEINRGIVGDRLQQLKMRAIYTDFVAGKFVSPLALPNPEELADSLIADVEFSLPHHRAVAATIATPEQWRAQLRQVDDILAQFAADGKSVQQVYAETTELVAAKMRAESRGRGKSTRRPSSSSK